MFIVRVVVISGLKGLKVGVKCCKFGKRHVFTSRLLPKQPVCPVLCLPRSDVTTPLPVFSLGPTPQESRAGHFLH